LHSYRLEVQLQPAALWETKMALDDGGNVLQPILPFVRDQDAQVFGLLLDHSRSEVEV
jgi:hypothetical protein